MEQLYLVMNRDYSDVDVVGLYEGPPGLDIAAEHERFQKQFNYHGLGYPVYPEYTGPRETANEKSAGQPRTSCVSGSIYVSDPQGVPVPDSPEYEAWRAECQRISKDWDVRREARLAEVRALYPGDQPWDMFLSYLERALGLRKMAEEVQQVWL